MKRISALIKEAPELPLPFHHRRTQREVHCTGIRTRTSPDTSSAGILRLDFLASRTVVLEGFFWLHCTACWILVPQPEIKPMPLAVEVWILNHWATREEYFCWSSQSGLRPAFSPSI